MTNETWVSHENYDKLLAHLGKEKEKYIQPCAKPEWIRLPAPKSRCPWTQLSRSAMIEMIVEPAAAGALPVKVAKIIREGNTRGITLIHYDSLMGYLDDLAAKGRPYARV